MNCNYYFRYIALLAVACFAVFSFRKIVKGKKLKNKLKYFLCVVLSVGFLLFSFYGLNFQRNNPNINRNVSKQIEKLVALCSLEEKENTSCLYDCKDYYGWIRISPKDETIEEKTKSYPLKFNDGEYNCFGAPLHFSRDILMYPNMASGGFVAYNEELCVTVTYFYKPESRIPILRHFIFTELITKPEINLAEIVEGIDAESIMKESSEDN